MRPRFGRRPCGTASTRRTRSAARSRTADAQTWAGAPTSVRARLSEDLPPQSPNYGASPPGRGRNSLASPVRGALTGTGTAPCRGGIASFDRQPGLLPQQGKLPGHGPSAAGEQARRADHPSRMNPTGRHATRASPNRSIGQRPIRLVDRSVPGPPQALLGVRFKASETSPCSRWTSEMSSSLV
jgi:hypothetical protein